jgi:hypothetical protein
MTVANVLTMKRVVIGCLCAVAVAAVGCGGSGLPTSPSAPTGSSGLAASFPRSGELHVEKECSQYAGQAGQFCTITSSNLREIEKDSRVIYASNLAFPLLDTDVALELPGPGNNRAFGHCRLNLITEVGLCTFSGGTGKFTHFSARVDVSSLGGPNWAWNGTYTFTPQD